MMRRILISLAFLSLLSTAAYAQSGRNKGSGGKPPVAAVPPRHTPPTPNLPEGVRQKLEQMKGLNKK